MEYILTRRVGEALALTGMLKVEIVALRGDRVRLKVTTDTALPVQRVWIGDLVTRYWRSALAELVAKAARMPDEVWEPEAATKQARGIPGRR